MKSEAALLTPRFCENKDILRGWVILHKDVTRSRSTEHLDYIRLHCRETNRTTYCRIYGPGTVNPYNGDDQAIVKESIYLDAHYRKRLGIPEQSMGTKKLTFDIKGVSSVCYYIAAACHHPDDSVRVGSFLGIASAILGITSIVLGIWSVVLSFK